VRNTHQTFFVLREFEGEINVNEKKVVGEKAAEFV
jgi:hypothetical protein